MKGKMIKKRKTANTNFALKSNTSSGINLVFSIVLFSFFYILSCHSKTSNPIYDVIVLGGGTGATAAAIQSARSGAKTLWVNPLAWPGGMLTAAGVSATDGNHRLPAGLWGEFRQLIWEHYGGADAVFTGWVSNTMFEPKIGQQYFEKMIQAEKKLEVWKNTEWGKIEKHALWTLSLVNESMNQSVQGKVLVDGTDLGDVAAQVGAAYNLGMDSRSQTGESMALQTANNIIQDLTYAAILKDFGKNSNKTISKPKDYDPSQFYCSCQSKKCTDPQAHSCEKMLTYGQLPNQKYMINWPKHGNDYYANVVEMSRTERQAVYEHAKQKTLQFIYFIQTELDYAHLGLAEDEFPTNDQLPLYPYHREGRRIHGQVQLNVHHILEPYAANLYRTGIAVGDYPIDHHHAEKPDAPDINFPPVPSFSIPLGSLIPKQVEDLVVADKAISVTNIVNGASRLQPVVLQVGQVAGIIAALSARQNISPAELNIRSVQKEVLQNQGYLLPFIDVSKEDRHFQAVQKIGACGILRGQGIPFQWANQTWFYPDSTILGSNLLENLRAFDPNLSVAITKDKLSIKNAINFVFEWQSLLKKQGTINTKSDFLNHIEKQWTSNWQLQNFQLDRWISKKELAVLIDHIIDPFQIKTIDFAGNLSH